MAKTTPPARPASSPRLGLGLVLIAISALASLALTLKHWGSFPLPGCGLQSACQRASESAWGTVPGLNWPVSHLGVAYFGALALAWLLTRGHLPQALRWIVRLGALGSLVWLTAMVHGGYLCPWCLGVHAANLGFLALCLRPAGATAAAPGLKVFAAGLLLITVVGLLPAELRHRRLQKANSLQQFEESTQAILGSTESPSRPLVGRHRRGPARAAIRLVVLSDYQCPDCRTIEGEIEELFRSRDDMALSVLHFPHCGDCNWKVAESGRTKHPNACWAARAAETASILGGTDAFWRMHAWLFREHGSFTKDELRRGLAELGFEAAEFERIMTSPETLERVQADVDEAVSLGISFTPMIFINGVEFRGWQSPGALTRAVERIAAEGPAASDGRDDVPLRGLEKFLNDWREEPERDMPLDPNAWAIGPNDAEVTVVLWGDYREPNTALLDARMRAAVEAEPRARYVYRHYPFDSSCNPYLARVVYENSCMASSAAEAAGALAGPGAFWDYHRWLFENEGPLDSDRLLAQAAALGLDVERFRAQMEAPQTRAAIRSDVDAGKSLGIPVVPALFIHSRFVPRWKLRGEQAPEAMLREALESP